MIQRSFKKIVHYVKFTTVCLNFRPCKILVSYLSTIFTYISRDLLPCPLNFQTVLSDLHPALPPESYAHAKYFYPARPQYCFEFSRDLLLCLSNYPARLLNLILHENRYQMSRRAGGTENQCNFDLM